MGAAMDLLRKVTSTVWSWWIIGGSPRWTLTPTPMLSNLCQTLGLRASQEASPNRPCLKAIFSLKISPLQIIQISNSIQLLMAATAISLWIAALVGSNVPNRTRSLCLSSNPQVKERLIWPITEKELTCFTIAEASPRTIQIVGMVASLVSRLTCWLGHLVVRIQKITQRHNSIHKLRVPSPTIAQINKIRTIQMLVLTSFPTLLTLSRWRTKTHYHHRRCRTQADKSVSAAGAGSRKIVEERRALSGVKPGVVDKMNNAVSHKCRWRIRQAEFKIQITPPIIIFSNNRLWQTLQWLKRFKVEQLWHEPVRCPLCLVMEGGTGVKTFPFAKCRSTHRTPPWLASPRIITSARPILLTRINNKTSSFQESLTIVLGSCPISLSCCWEIILQITTSGRQLSHRTAKITIITLTSTSWSHISVSKLLAGLSSVQVPWMLWKHPRMIRRITIGLLINSLQAVDRGSKALQHQSRSLNGLRLVREGNKRVVH